MTFGLFMFSLSVLLRCSATKYFKLWIRSSAAILLRQGYEGFDNYEATGYGGSSIGYPASLFYFAKASKKPAMPRQESGDVRKSCLAFLVCPKRDMKRN